jgi:hypothetical protein
MSIGMLSPAGEPGRQAARKHDRALRTVLGVLDDGTAFYAPIGEVITDGTRVHPFISRGGVLRISEPV